MFSYERIFLVLTLSTLPDFCFFIQANLLLSRRRGNGNLIPFLLTYFVTAVKRNIYGIFFLVRRERHVMEKNIRGE